MTFDLASLGWDADVAAAFAPLRGTDARPARVARVDRGVCTTIAAAGTERAAVGGALLVAAAADPTRLPCVGDWVVLRDWPDRRLTVEAVLPRRTRIVRAGAGRQAVGQVLAANLDLAVVVEPLDPQPEPARVERLLALAWQSGARPLLVLTKADLVPDPELLAAQVAGDAPGVEVRIVAAQRGTGVAELCQLARPGRTLALLGASGAGKSTLVNALVGATVMGTQAPRADGKGRHTTSYRSLIPLPGGGVVLDTPGLRAVGMFDGADGLDRVFTDVTALAARCRFGDCAHDREPGCAIRAALESGELSARRYHSWRTLRRELDWQTRRAEVRVADAKARRLRRADREFRRTVR